MLTIAPDKNDDADVVEITASEVAIEYAGCGSHGLRVTLLLSSQDAVAALRAVSVLLLRAGNGDEDLARWVAEAVAAHAKEEK